MWKNCGRNMKKICKLSAACSPATHREASEQCRCLELQQRHCKGHTAHSNTFWNSMQPPALPWLLFSARSVMVRCSLQWTSGHRQVTRLRLLPGFLLPTLRIPHLLPHLLLLLPFRPKLPRRHRNRRSQGLRDVPTSNRFA